MIKSATSMFLPFAAPFLFYCMSWDPLLSNKFLIFMWKLTNKFLPVDNVRQRIGFQLAFQCHYCQGQDSIAHIFLHYPYAIFLWSHVTQITGLYRVPWPFFFSIKDYSHICGPLAIVRIQFS